MKEIVSYTRPNNRGGKVGRLECADDAEINSSCALRAVRGNVAVELALLAPILMALLVGAVDFSSMIYEQMRLASAVRTGVQFTLQSDFSAQDLDGVAATLCSNTEGLADIREAVCDATGLDQSQVTVTPSCECADGSSVDCTATCSDGSVYVNVAAQVEFQTLFSYPLIDNPLTLTADATIRVQ